MEPVCDFNERNAPDPRVAVQGVPNGEIASVRAADHDTSLGCRDTEHDALALLLVWSGHGPVESV